jgi:hypothetical protein
MKDSAHKELLKDEYVFNLELLFMSIFQNSSYFVFISDLRLDNSLISLSILKQFNILVRFEYQEIFPYINIYVNQVSFKSLLDTILDFM